MNVIRRCKDIPIEVKLFFKLNQLRAEKNLLKRKGFKIISFGNPEANKKTGYKSEDEEWTNDFSRAKRMPDWPMTV